MILPSHSLPVTRNQNSEARAERMQPTNGHGGRRLQRLQSALNRTGAEILSYSAERLLGTGLTPDTVARMLGIQLVDGDGERVNGIGEARFSCAACGGRALEASGHPQGKNGVPACLAVKRLGEW